MVRNAIGMSIGSPDPEQVARLFLPESCADRATFLDYNTRFVPAMDSEDAHRHLIDARDPDHGELSRMSLVQAYVAKPERADGRSLVDNPLESHRAGRMELRCHLFQGLESECIGDY